MSRDGIVPITADQDTAGPLARTVEDAARVLGVIAGYDPSDPATAACLIPGNCYADYTRFLDRAALRGARIAIPRSWWGGLDAERLRIMNEAIATMRAQGAVVVDPVALNVNLGGIAISYPPPVGSSTVLIYGMKRDLNRYLASLGPNAPRQSLTQIIAFNNANAAQALRFGQSILVAADLYNTTPGSPDEVRYLADRQRDLTNSRAALDGAFAGPDGQPGTADDFDALLFPSWFGADTPARAGYPSIAVPAGFVVRNRPLPFCATFCGRAFSEPRLIALAYAFEQAKQHRASSRFTPALPTDAIPLSFPEVARLGSGCQGTGGVPEIGLRGSPIAGNSALAVEVSQLAASSTAFLGISAAPGSGAMIGACVLHAGFPFDLQLVATSNAAGTAEFPVPLPWDPSLGGVRVWLQGGALDAGGAGLGLVALTAGLEVTIGA